MTPGPRALAGAYASLARPDGIALYGSAESLRQVAQLLRQGSPAEIALAAPPEDVVETAPIRAIRILVGDDGQIELRTNEEAIEIAGGTAARNKLAATFENLAETLPPVGSVPRHVDLEHFPGHGFLSEDSMWMTIFLLPEPTA